MFKIYHRFFRFSTFFWSTYAFAMKRFAPAYPTHLRAIMRIGVLPQRWRPGGGGRQCRQPPSLVHLPYFTHRDTALCKSRVCCPRKKGGICLPFYVLRITNSLMRSQTCILQRISPCVEGSIYGLGSAMKIILILYTLCNLWYNIKT